ncbi:MAG: trigger factor [Bacteroidota bacterium]|nr:trigger factor [Bacteroidota bacterium]
MNITLENVGNSESVIRMQLLEEDYQEKVNSVLKDYRKQAELKGFRKGMVPMGIIKKRFGISILVEEINKIVSNKLAEYFKTEEIDILGDPMPSEEHQSPIDWESQKEFEFVFDIGLSPKIDINLSVEKDEVPYYNIEVSEKMIDDSLASYQQNFGKLIEQEIAEKESKIVADFIELNEDGDEKENGIQVEEVEFLLRIIKDEEIQNSIIGANIPQIISLNIRKAFPNNDEIASMLKIEKEQAADLNSDFQITIKKISKWIDAEIGQELFDSAFEQGTVSSEEEFRLKIKENIAKQLIPESDYKFTVDIKEYLIQKYDIELPAEFLKRWMLAKNEKITKEQIEKDWTEFKNGLVWQIISSRIAKEKDIKLEEKDIMKMAEKLAYSQFQQYGIQNAAQDQIKMFAEKILEEEEQRENISHQALDEKIYSALKDMVKLDLKKVSAEDFKKLFETTPQIKADELKLDDEAKSEDASEPKEETSE